MGRAPLSLRVRSDHECLLQLPYPVKRDELSGGALPEGERSVTAALVRDDTPVLTSVHVPLTAMLIDASVVRVSVPATMRLIHVAAGRMDAFREFSDVRSGLLPGALPVSEAGDTVTDTEGRPWSPAGSDFLACTPGVHTQAVNIASARA
ncbi:hypothetical protein OV320_0799 [Actinobacteria bacterium OV320]|nr:hypothetical protein OV320_0799 [Actinobacteria bacterium OV320]